MSITSAPFGHTKRGTPVTAYRLENEAGAYAVVLNYGATIQSLCVPDREGRLVDVVLGYDTIQEYEEQNDYFGATIGRVANRIAGGRFFLNGNEYRLARNDGENHLHGGMCGFDKQFWHGRIDDGELVLARTSPNGEEGYPGAMEVKVRFALDGDNTLRIQYDAWADQDTPVNLTNHSYFNLAGKGKILEHILQINAQRYAEAETDWLPTGRLLEVEGTPFDFREARAIGNFTYDHNYVLSGSPAARLACLETGIALTVETDLPGLQVYTGSMLTSRKGKGGAEIWPRSAVCLETQIFPDGMHHYGFPNPFLPAGLQWHSETRYHFSQIP